MHHEGVFALDIPLLGEALVATPARILTFGDRGSVGVGKLRALLREIRSLETVGVVVTRDAVVLTYRGPTCRGSVRLHLHDPIVDEDVLLVPLGVVRKPEAPPTMPSTDSIITAPRSIRSELPPEEEPEPRIDRPPAAPPARPFLVILLEVARDLLGGSP
jgi:hypothetical protein